MLLDKKYFFKLCSKKEAKQTILKNFFPQNTISNYQQSLSPCFGLTGIDKLPVSCN